MQPLTYGLKHWKKKTSTKWISVSDFAVHPRSGRENVAEMCAPSPTLTYVLLTYVLAIPDWTT